jgi:hypothetical protein
MPARLIRDKILDSERYHACGVESRLLFLELLLCADDYGLVPINDVYLRRHTTVCEGKTPAQIAGFLTPLMEQDLIRAYDGPRGGRFSFIPRFDNRPQAIKPKWPLPPDGLDEGYIAASTPTARNLSYPAKSRQIKGIYSIQHGFNTNSKAETETETDTETKEKSRDANIGHPMATPSESRKPVESVSKTKGTRFALSTLPDEWSQICRSLRKDLHPESTFDRFRDYWIAQPGSKGVKLDWLATWRNWCRNEKASHQPTPVAADDPFLNAI